MIQAANNSILLTPFGERNKGVRARAAGVPGDTGLPAPRAHPGELRALPDRRSAAAGGRGSGGAPAAAADGQRPALPDAPEEVPAAAAYANVHEAGNVEYPTAALRPDHPYQQVPDNQLESMCSPHYEKILLSTPAEATIHSAEQADYPEQSQDVINFKRYQNLWSGNAYASSDDARRVGEWLAMG
eukprot:CAMPEP_0206397614 /NCGR_PEP_ID=MMETSP0294-20121207/23606_1 /ASSEMBLY_ACC=CAM_ASM_000327 /TAXON_ID=39354 /ORGANISM="Heterosigma akashiwo, Strain CCMP2393" /LENGTH=185 /DNA_ID=CAMNT_0053852811 /DNA_START=733 /DNA_END=1288 /DNA_ORIENTATION=-